MAQSDRKNSTNDPAFQPVLQTFLNTPPKPHKAEAPVRAKRKQQTDPVKDVTKPTPARKPKAVKGKA